MRVYLFPGGTLATSASGARRSGACGDTAVRTARRHLPHSPPPLVSDLTGHDGDQRTPVSGGGHMTRQWIVTATHSIFNRLTEKWRTADMNPFDIGSVTFLHGKYVRIMTPFTASRPAPDPPAGRAMRASGAARGGHTSPPGEGGRESWRTVNAARRNAIRTSRIFHDVWCYLFIRGVGC